MWWATDSNGKGGTKSSRLRRRREDLHEEAHRNIVRRQYQKRPAGSARGRRVRQPGAAADPSEQAHGTACRRRRRQEF